MTTVCVFKLETYGAPFIKRNKKELLRTIQAGSGSIVGRLCTDDTEAGIIHKETKNVAAAGVVDNQVAVDNHDCGHRRHFHSPRILWMYAVQGNPVTQDKVTYFLSDCVDQMPCYVAGGPLIGACSSVSKKIPTPPHHGGS